MEGQVSNEGPASKCIGPSKFETKGPLQRGPSKASEERDEEGLSKVAHPRMIVGSISSCNTGESEVDARGPLPLIATAQLSPISAMVQRIGGVTLKRAATDPSSPEPIKRRRLFGEGSPIPTEEGSLPRGKKSVRNTKKDLRRNNRGGRTRNVDQPRVEEVDFPIEWTLKIEGQKAGEDDPMVKAVSGGCTATATEEK